MTWGVTGQNANDVADAARSWVLILVISRSYDIYNYIHYEIVEIHMFIQMRIYLQYKFTRNVFIPANIYGQH